MTPKETDRAIRGFVERARREGMWQARCPCGATCGGKLGDASQPPYPQGDPTIACPSCRRVGTQSGIHYVFLTPEELG